MDTDSIGMDDISGDPEDGGVCEDPDDQDPSEHMSEGEQEEEDAAGPPLMKVVFGMFNIGNPRFQILSGELGCALRHATLPHIPKNFMVLV